MGIDQIFIVYLLIGFSAAFVVRLWEEEPMKINVYIGIIFAWPLALVVVVMELLEEIRI